MTGAVEVEGEGSRPANTERWTAESTRENHVLHVRSAALMLVCYCPLNKN